MKKENSNKRILVVGGIGRTERENRDNSRVVDRGGCCYGLKAHIQYEPPLVARKWEKRL